MAASTSTERRDVPARGWRPGLAVLALVATLPVIVGLVRAVTSGWVALGDEGVIVARSFDVLSSHSPLLGQSSVSGTSAGQATHSLGPLQYWLLALPSRTPWGAAPVVAVGLVNAACLAWAVLLVGRRAGEALAFTFTSAVVLAAWSLNGDLLADVWNPWAALAPLALVFVLSWRIGLGDLRLLPALALVASYAVQLHLTYVLPTLASIVIAAGGLALWRPTSLSAWRRPVVWTVGVLAICWVAPIVEQLTERPGNFVALFRTATSGDPTIGLRHALDAAVATFGVRPWWLQRHVAATDIVPGMVVRPAATQVLTAAVVVAGLAASAFVGWRRRRPEVALAPALMLGLVAAFVLVVRSTPAGPLSVTLTYVARWGTVAGVLGWAVLLWSLVELTGVGRRWPPWVVRAVALGAVSVIAVVVTVSGDGDRRSSFVGDVARTDARLDAALGTAPAVRVVSAGRGLTAAGVEVPLGVVSALRTQGRRVEVSPLFSALLGDQYGLTAARMPTVFVSAAGGPMRGRRVSVLDVGDPAGPVSVGIG